MNLRKKIRGFFTLTRKANGGFTLVELVVVIAILAILAGAAVPAYSGYINKANEAADQQLLAALNTAYASACMENGKFDMTQLGFTPVATIDDNGAVAMSQFNDSFQNYFGTGAFKYYDKLGFVASEGVFKGNTIAELVQALQTAWGESSMKKGGKELLNVLLTEFDSIGEFLGLGLDLNKLMSMAPDQLSGVLGFSNITPLDDELEAYLMANYPEYANSPNKKQWKEDNNTTVSAIKGNLGVLQFANDAAGRTAEEVMANVMTFKDLLAAGDADTEVTKDMYMAYYESTLTGTALAEYQGKKPAEKWDEAKNNFVNKDGTDGNYALKFGDLELTADQLVRISKAAKDAEANDSGISTLGSMYALAAGYFNSQYYKDSGYNEMYKEATGQDYEPNFSEFESFLVAAGQSNFEDYCANNGMKDMQAYLDFMNYLSTSDVDMTDSEAFSGQLEDIWGVLGK